VESEQLTLEPATPGTSTQPNIELQQDEILNAVSASRFDTLHHRVAWILNHYPATRDSDVALYIQYWKEFESEYVSGDSVDLKDIYRLTRPASLTRARAKLQNEFRLFLASAEVRKRRGTLSEEEKEKALAIRPVYPMYTAYTDESGKTDDFLVVGAVWFVNGPEIVDVTRAVDKFAQGAGVAAELHFKTITDANLAYYRQVADLVVSKAATVSFTSISVDRRGHKNIESALSAMHYHLLLRGIEYQNDSGRAPLPRSLSVFKDREEAGRDKLLMEDLRVKLKQAGETQFGGHLYVDRLVAVDSRENIPVQLADLYTSSVARVLNAKGKRDTARDAFADHLLGLLGTPKGPVTRHEESGIVMHTSL
jgi:hypothetical protein